MNKKQRINLILILLLAAVGVFIATQNFDSDTTLNGDIEYDFSIEDTAAVTKIIIATREPDSVVLERVDGGWMVNGEHRARPDAVDVLLETFHNIELRNFPAETAKQTVLRRMAGYGKFVKVYKGDELVHDFIVGTDQNDMLGTYMMKRDGTQPYAMHIPSFNGYLSSRFFVREDLWRNRIIFGWDDKDIQTVTMNYELIPQEGFRIEQTEEGALSVFDANDNPIEPYASQHTRYYLGSLRTLKFEGAIIEGEKAYAKMDSITSSIPVFELNAKKFDGEEIKLSAYHIRAEPDTYDDLGNLMLWDPDRFYAYLSDGRFVVIQTYAFENILKTKEYFIL